jgi:cell division protein FtsI/penicillin-binding protein 2
MSYWRFNLIFFLIFLFGAGIICRLVFLQILNHNYYLALAKGQQEFFEQIKGERGEIFLKDKEGNLYPLAINKEFFLVFVSPKEIKEKEKVAEILSEILNLEKGEILEKLKKNSFYEIIKRKLNSEEIEKLKKLKFSGIYLKKETLRYYPQKTLLAKIIGFLGGEEKGQYGLEGYYDDWLSGKKKFLKDSFFSKFLLDQKGADLILTLDYNIQYKAENLLKKAKENFDIKEGTIIVLEPFLGKIIALANFPNFDPNQYSKVKNWEIFQNGALQKLFEPGSTFKAITLAAALNEEKITPETTYIDEGKIKVQGHIIRNYDFKKWGKRTMTEVLEKSINTGVVFAKEKIGDQTFLKYIKDFGFFEKTGVDLEGEVFSQNSQLKNGYKINFATASFGQGIEVTPLQLARAYCAIINGGKLVRPYIVEKIIKDGKEIEIQPKISNDKVISLKTSAQLTAMLVSVVKNGFAKGAQISGYYIGGKTGTSQIPFSVLGIKKKGYSEKTFQTFVGFGPAFNPKFLILVTLTAPKTKSAVFSAVPIFKELAKYIIDYWQIPPDYE